MATVTNSWQSFFCLIAIMKSKSQMSLRAFGKQSQTLWLLEIATLPATRVARNDISYGVPMSTKLDWLTQEINGLKEQGLYNNIRTIGSAQGARLIVDGKDVLNFCSNNYLGSGEPSEDR